MCRSALQNSYRSVLLIGCAFAGGCATSERIESPHSEVELPAHSPAHIALPDATRPAPAPVQSREPGDEIVMRALALVGTPYRYGGLDPTIGVDCSGLVYYIYQTLGVSVPRTASEQYAAARRISLGELAPGDLLFFKLRGRRISHVAIYVGEGRFVHAPQSGRAVTLSELNDAYYRPRLVSAGRLY